MKQYYGNYLGIVINGGEKDPEGRGRCQVFIPHIMPSLYEGWNKEGEDINFEIIGNGLPTALNSDIVERLTKILPWAECAAPIVGSSPSVKDGSEEARNAALRAGSFGPPPGAFADTFGGGSDAEAVRNTFAARYGGDIISGYCGKDAKDVLTKLFDYPADTPGANGKDWAKKLEGLGWTKVSNNPADVTPLSMGVWGSGPHGHVATGVRLSDGRTGWVGGSKRLTTPDSDKFLRGGGSKLNADPNNFLGVWEPPPDRLNIARSKLGQPPINPSMLTGTQGTNMTPDGTIPADAQAQASGTLSVSGVGQVSAGGGSAVNADGISAGALEYAMRMAAAESGAGIPGMTGNQVASYLNNVQNTVAMSQGRSTLGVDVRGKPQSQVNAWGQQIIDSGRVRTNRLDIGYTQHNADDMRSYGIRNYGSYRDQILSVARHVQNQANNNSAFAAALNNRQFSTAESLKDGKIVPGWNNRIYTSTNLAKKDKLTSIINSQYGGNAQAAFDAFAKIYPDTPPIEAMLNSDFNSAAYATAAGEGSIPGASTLTHRPTRHQRNDGPDTNYQALGMFGYASEGTAVWVFFREGNPLFPVYFAASYGQREWANMYSYSSPGIGAGVGGKGAIPNTEKMRMNSYGGGFESAQVSEDPESGLEPEFNFQVYGKNGSNLLFTKDHTEFNSTYNHNQRVSGDFHEITEANKETRVRGDKNTYVEQDVYITIGNWSDEAIAACDEIQGYINEAMDVMSAAGDSGSTTAGTSTQEPISIDEAKERARAQQDKFVRQRQEIDRLQAKIDKLPPSEQAQAEENLNETIRLLSNKVAAATP